MRAPCFLRPDVHAIQLGEDLVLLDVAADRYACLTEVTGRAALSPTRERLEVFDGDLLARLQGEGLLCADPQTPRPPLPPLPARSAIPARIPPPRAGDIPTMAASLADLARRYRGRTLAQLIAAAGRPRPAAPDFGPDLQTAVARLHAWAPYAPVPTKCLLRSFMLLRMLRRRELDALWVFGVRTWPFHAHCWLQAGEVVLDDWAERTWAYAPILAV